MTMAKDEYSGTSVWAVWSRRATAAIDLLGSGLNDSYACIDGARGPTAAAGALTMSKAGVRGHDRSDRLAIGRA